MKFRTLVAGAAVRDLVQQAERECPVCQAIRGNVEMTVDFQFDPSARVGVE